MSVSEQYCIGKIEKIFDSEKNRRIVINSLNVFFYETNDRKLKISVNDEISFLYHKNQNNFLIGNFITAPPGTIEDLLKLKEEKKKKGFKSNFEMLNEIKEIKTTLKEISKTFIDLNDNIKKITGVLK